MEQTDSTIFQFAWQEISNALMKRMNLESGEKVLIVASPGRFNPLVSALIADIERSNGKFLGVISVDSVEAPDGWNTMFTQEAYPMSMDEMTQHFQSVDLAIMMPGATISHKPYKAMQQVLMKGTGRTIHFHWSGAYGIDGGALSITPDIDKHYQESVLNTDYRTLSSLHQFFEESARSLGVHVTTPSGTDLSFTLGDRPVTKQDGDASRGRTEYARNLIDREIELPAGAIRVAPIEVSVNGKIAFPDAAWNGKPVTGLVFTIDKGKITKIDATDGLDAVKAELDSAGPAGYSFREFALGFNPLLSVTSNGDKKWIPYYGYGAGVVRLSLGDNTELGGSVKGGYVRWNFFTDATVALGDKVIVIDGKMLH